MQQTKLLTFVCCLDPEGNILEIQRSGSMPKVNVKEKFTLFEEYWTPKILGEINNFHVKIFKAKGEFIWHKHENDDEFFLVIEGELTIKIRNQKDIVLKEGEFYIVPKGIEHCPLAHKETHVLLLEPKEVVNTGEKQDLKTAKNLEWI